MPTPPRDPVGVRVGPPEWVEQVLAVVDEVPPGAVLSYGDVAQLRGVRGARLVGRAMAMHGSLTAWWRVVHADGRLPAGHEDEAGARLRAEGVRVVAGRVDFARHRWAPPHDWVPPHERPGWGDEAW